MVSCRLADWCLQQTFIVFGMLDCIYTHTSQSKWHNGMMTLTNLKIANTQTDTHTHTDTDTHRHTDRHPHTHRHRHRHTDTHRYTDTQTIICKNNNRYIQNSMAHLIRWSSSNFLSAVWTTKIPLTTRRNTNGHHITNYICMYIQN